MAVQSRAAKPTNETKFFATIEDRNSNMGSTIRFRTKDALMTELKKILGDEGQGIANVDTGNDDLEDLEIYVYEVVSVCSIDAAVAGVKLTEKDMLL